jgi:hypothetical protein
MAKVSLRRSRCITLAEADIIMIDNNVVDEFFDRTQMRNGVESVEGLVETTVN